jgi:UDP-N-acetylglucosamine transferase subunit ALG13
LKRFLLRDALSRSHSSFAITDSLFSYPDNSMILVTVGTEKFPFNRLMHWIDALLRHNFLQEGQPEIVVQYGSCTYLPSGVKVYPILPEAKFRKLMQQADLIVAHCGEGSINILEEIETPFILVPRCQSFGEHVDNHQIELAAVLAKSNIPIAWSPGDLARFIAAPKRVALANFPEAALLNLSYRLEDRFGQGQSLNQLKPSLP